MRFVAFLRGVSPLNAKMSELKRCFESAGFTAVTTVLGSGNVIFDVASTSSSAIERRAEAAMQRELGRTFPVIVRTMSALQALLANDPYATFKLPPTAKRVVTFLRRPPPGKIILPPELDGARLLAVSGCEVFTAYTPSPRGPVFMTLIEKTFGTDVTTRTWETIRKCTARA